jgi:hypothetical protein
MTDTNGSMIVGYVAKERAEQLVYTYRGATEAIRQHLRGIPLLVSEADPIEVLTILQSMAIMELQDKIEEG